MQSGAQDTIRSDSSSKLVPYERISWGQQRSVSFLLGVNGNSVKVAAKSNGNGLWKVFRKNGGRKASGSSKWVVIHSGEGLQEVLDLFRRINVEPYCLQANEPMTGAKPRHSRKSVQLTGRFFTRDSHTPGDMVVEELSVAGLKFYIVSPMNNVQSGDDLMVKFRLDDEKGTILRKRVSVKKVAGHYVEVLFRQLHIDPELDKYLR
jgi:hypothetical protein